MKTCPFCAEEIQDAAVVCKHCGRDLKGDASQVQIVAPPKKTGVAAWGCLTLIVLVVVVAIAGQCGRTAGPSRTSATAPSTQAGPQLALLSSRGYASSSAYMSVEGEVENLSHAQLNGIVAVTTWYDKQNTLIASDEAVIRFDPLMPGQKSPFKTISRTNPLMENYTVQFRVLRGGQIEADDRRKIKK